MIPKLLYLGRTSKINDHSISAENRIFAKTAKVPLKSSLTLFLKSSSITIDFLMSAASMSDSSPGSIILSGKIFVDICDA